MEEEFNEILRCTAPLKAWGEDTVYSIPIKECQPANQKVVAS